MRNDQVFTPIYIVKQMLDKIGYEGENIKYKKILEPSFGSGMFLLQIVRRILDYAKSNALSEKDIITILDNVHGVELDEELYKETKKTLIDYCKDNGVHYNWPNLICGDSTKINFNHEYDFVVGNPPYIRIHDLKKEEREHIENNFKFSQGNNDLYITFFEIGLNAMKKDGTLSYIAPNSFMKNSSQKEFRKYLVSHNLVDSIVDYGKVPVFGEIATYTAITTLHKNKNKKTRYIKMKDRDFIEYETDIDLSTFNSKPWFIVSDEDKKFLDKIKKRKVKLSDLCEIQYGLATNADEVYIVEKQNVCNFEKEILRPVVKGSRLDASKHIIFPYAYNEEEKRFEIIKEDALSSKYPKTYAYLMSQKERLKKRDLEKNAVWYQYGRSQGIQKSKNKKIVVQQIIDLSANKCRIEEYDENTLVYSGIFIVVKDEKKYECVKKVLMSNEFCKYVKLIGKDMSGGYKSFNANIIKDFGVIAQ